MFGTLLMFVLRLTACSGVPVPFGDLARIVSDIFSHQSSLRAYEISCRAEEQWQPYKSTLLQVFISIQSMILIDVPYFNEYDQH